MASVRDFKAAFTTSVARRNLSCDCNRSDCSPGISRIATAGRFPARATVAFPGRAEEPFPFGGGTSTGAFFCCIKGFKVGARKDRNDSIVAEVHAVVEATAR